MLCKACGGTCKDEPSAEMPVEIACPGCNEAGCESCGDTGYFNLTECPQRYVGGELTEAINMAGMCGGGLWPVAGGLLDQSAWFVDLWQQLQSEQNKIDQMKASGWRDQM